MTMMERIEKMRVSDDVLDLVFSESPYLECVAFQARARGFAAATLRTP